MRAILEASEGPLAPESAYRERVETRRLRRYRREGNLRRQRQREATWAMLHAPGRLMDWVLWDEYHEASPTGSQRVIGDPRQWMAMVEAATKVHRAEWNAPTLARVLDRNWRND